MLHSPLYPTAAIEPRLHRGVLALLYLAALIGMSGLPRLAHLAPGIDIWSPAVGLSVALLVASGARMLPLVGAGFLLNALLVEGQPLSVGMVELLVLEVALYQLVAIVLQRSIRRYALRSMIGIARVVAIGMVLPLPIGLILYAVGQPAAAPGSVMHLTRVLEHWLCDAIGIIVVVPALLLSGLPRLADKMRRGEWRLPQLRGTREVAGLALQLLGLAAVFWAVFASPLALYRPFYLFFLPLIWITLSHGISGALWTILAVSCGSMVAFALPSFDHDQLIDLQLFLLAHALTGIVLGALVREQARFASALQQSESRANAILHDQIDLICRYRLDTSLTFVNEAYTRFFGRSAADLIGTSFLPLTRSEYHATIERQIAEIVQTRRPFTDESTILRCDGSLRWIQWVNHAIVDARGVVTEVQVVGRDITERRRAEEAYRSLVDQSSQGLTLIRGLKPLFVNPALCEMLGFTRDELKTLPQMLDVLLPEDRARLVDEVINAPVASWSGRTFEVQLVRPDGERRWIEVHLATTVYEGLPATMVMVIDIHARKVAEAALEQAEQHRLAIERRLQETQKLESLGLLAGGIAHDFNNLLVGVMGNAGLALAELPSGSSAVESIRQIEVAAKHAADLTRQLLAYAGKGSVSIRKIEVDGLIEEMIQLLRLGVPREIALRSQLSPERLVVEGDISQIRQVLMNIVINGAEAIGPRPGSITIATRSCWIGPQELRDLSIRTEIAEGRYVAIDVTDTGGGMDEATLQRIFEPFFTTKISGRGLGLAAVIGIVCAHRGAMKIHSAPGEGSTFTVLLPSIPTALVDHEELAPVVAVGASA